jgi:hypothetical protein
MLFFISYVVKSYDDIILIYFYLFISAHYIYKELFQTSVLGTSLLSQEFMAIVQIFIVLYLVGYYIKCDQNCKQRENAPLEKLKRFFEFFHLIHILI